MPDQEESPRGETHHPEPPDPSELHRFPAREVNTRWFRAHVERDGPDRGLWWFSSVTDVPAKAGRFDLPPPRGTCYLGASEEIAARERVGTQLRRKNGQESVTAAALTTKDGPVVVTSVPNVSTHAANLSVKPAQRYIDRSLSSGTGIYAITQRWAAALRAAGFGAILYEPRYTSGKRARALAVFGDAGRPAPLPPVGPSRPLREVLEENGVRVVPRPRSAPALLPPETAPPSL